MTSPWLDKPTITGERVTLRPFRDEDFPMMWAAIADAEVRRFTGSVNTTAEAEEPDDDEATTRAWYTSRNDQDERLDLAVVDNATGRCVGEVVLNQVDADNESCNFRILLGPDGRDRGLGSEATRLLVDHAFRNLPLHRITLGVYEFNPRARRAYEKAGFVVEGREREALKFDDQRVDQVMMSILRPEWLAAQR
jgi:RimJ/RimL family protein N-acetyltransferase